MKFLTVRKDYHKMTLDQLWAVASEYGHVSIRSGNLAIGKEYYVSATITFNTIPGTELEAKSGINCTTPIEALVEAIENAEKILKQFKDM